MSKSVTLKKSQVGTIEQRWEKEKREADSLRIQLDQQTREKLALIDKLKSAQGEVDRLEKDKGALSREIDELIKDKEETKAKLTSLDANLRTVTKDKARVEKSVDKLAQENKEKLELIGQLEKVGSSLRDELMESRDSLSKVWAVGLGTSPPHSFFLPLYIFRFRVADKRPFVMINLGIKLAFLQNSCDMFT